MRVRAAVPETSRYSPTGGVGEVALAEDDTVEWLREGHVYRHSGFLALDVEAGDLRHVGHGRHQLHVVGQSQLSGSQLGEEGREGLGHGLGRNAQRVASPG